MINRWETGLLKLSCRQVLVTLLNVTHRLDWKTCILLEEKDKADVEQFKAAFAPFDPSLQ